MLSSGSSACIRVCARSHAGRASANLAVPALVIVTSFSRRSSPLRTAIQRASTSGRRLRVSVVSSSDVSPLRSPCRTWPGPREDVEQGVLGRAQADAAQLLVVEPADGSRRLTQGAAKAVGRGRVVVLRVHIRCICSELVVVKGRLRNRVKRPARRGARAADVESRCGAVVLGSAYLLPALSVAGASLASPCSVSTSRSSNRACRFPAPGFRTRLYSYSASHVRSRTVAATFVGAGIIPASGTGVDQGTASFHDPAP